MIFVCLFVTLQNRSQNTWYKGAKMWNDLPIKIKNYITLAEFKKQIKKWQGPRCLCNMCTRLL